MKDGENKGVEADVQMAPAEQKGVETDVQKAPVEQNEIDYKAELERVAKECDNYKTGMLNYKEISEKKPIVEEKPKEVDDSLAKIRQVLAEELDTRLNKFQDGIQGSVIDQKIGELSGNPDEQALIKFHFENSIKRTQSMSDDLQNAYALANAKKFQKKFTELRVAQDARSSATSSSAGGNTDRTTHVPEYFNAEQKAYFKTRGWDDAKIERYKQNLLKAKNK